MGQPVKIQARTRDGLGWNFDSLSRPGIFRDNYGTEGKNSKKIEMFEKRNIKIFEFFFCPGTEELVPGFLMLLLSRDKGTLGQGLFFCPGTKGWRDKDFFCPRTRSHLLETLVQIVCCDAQKSYRL